MRYFFVFAVATASLLLVHDSTAQQSGGKWERQPKNLSVGFEPREAQGTWTGTIEVETTHQERGKELTKRTNERPVELVVAADSTIEARWPAQGEGKAEEIWGKAARRPGERGLWIAAPGTTNPQRRGLWVRSTDGGKTLRIEYVEELSDPKGKTTSAGVGVLTRRS